MAAGQKMFPLERRPLVNTGASKYQRSTWNSDVKRTESRQKGSHLITGLQLLLFSSSWVFRTRLVSHLICQWLENAWNGINVDRCSVVRPKVVVIFVVVVRVVYTRSCEREIQIFVVVVWSSVVITTASVKCHQRGQINSSQSTNGRVPRLAKPALVGRT